MRIIRLFTIVTLVSLVACQQPIEEETADNHLGALNYEFNISTKAKTSFDEGLLLLHSFEYEDAREAFQKAYQLDATEVMVLWGETMTYYKALWKLQDVDAGRAEMA